MSEQDNRGVQFAGRLGLQQRVLPTYRLPFFRSLAAALPHGLALFAGKPHSGESINSLDPQQTVPDSNPSTFFTTNYHFLSPSSPFYLCWQAHLLRWLAEVDPQALVVEANPRIRSTPRAVRWMHTRHRRVIGWGLGAPAARGPLAGWRNRSWPRFLQQFDALLAYSPSGAEQYRRQGFPPERIFVAPNAVTPRPANPPPVRPDHVDDHPILLFVGRLQERKRVDLLLQAAAALPGLNLPRLVVVGDGPARSGLMALARQVYPSTEFPGERVGPDLEPYFNTADLFVLPGTGGLAVQQAMAHGLPVIAAEGDGTLDALIRPTNGWRVTPGDLTALTGTLQAALRDIPRLRMMGAESYRIVSEEVNLEMMVAAFRQALDT